MTKPMIPLSRPDHPDDPRALLSTLRDIVMSGRWTEGEYARSFEQRVAEECGSIYAVATNSGTSALELLCEASDFSQGTEIICPSYTFVATVNSILAAGAKPVFGDIDPETFNLNLQDVASRVTAKTRGLILVHQFGVPTDSQTFADFSKQHDLIFIEDAACGLGSKVRGKAVGTFGWAGLLSFHPRKVLSTGEGGMILTDHEELAVRARSLGNHGRDGRGGKVTERVGHNFRMSEFQAALGLWALDRVSEAVERRVALSKRYEKALSEMKHVTWTREPQNSLWNRQSYAIRVPGECRNIIAETLRKEGIETSPGPLPAHMHPFIEHMLHPPRLPETEKAYAETLLLPMYASLSHSDQDRVIDALSLALHRVVG